MAAATESPAATIKTHPSGHFTEPWISNDLELTIPYDVGTDNNSSGEEDGRVTLNYAKRGGIVVFFKTEIRVVSFSIDAPVIILWCNF